MPSSRWLVAASLFAAGAAFVSGAATPALAAAEHHPATRNGVQLQTSAASLTAGPSDITGNMTYHGGTNDGTANIGVVTGPPKVYIVYWGSQWGTASTNSAGYLTLSGDTKGAAPQQQAFFKGLGTNNETWSGVMTQYCQGAAAGATDCSASGVAHVGYPTKGALAGVWYDNAAPEPSNATGHDLAAEAVAAAAHFGNTTAASNQNAQYVITSPYGTHPDGFTIGSGFCAWHSWNGDANFLSSKGGTVSSTAGDILFSNMPGDIANASGCSGGGVGGFTAVNSHEYAEILTDPLTNFANNPTGGWFDSSGNENADKCQTDIGQLTLSTGTFSVEPTWSNEDSGNSGACSYSDPVVGGTPSATVTVTNPGSQNGTVGTPARLTVTATGGTAPYTWTATGLPAGLALDSSAGVISGTPTTAATSTVTVTATDAAKPAATAGTTFTWTIAPQASGGGLTNGGFETGTLSGWTTAGQATAITAPVHAGSYAARLGGPAATGTSSLAQTFTSKGTQLTLWVERACSSFGFGSITVTLTDATSHTSSTLLNSFCAQDSTFSKISASLKTGDQYTLTIANQDNSFSGNYASTIIDDVTVS